MAHPPTSEPVKARRLGNSALAACCAVGVVAMVGAAYAAVPLYKRFCEATGFDGTARRAAVGPSASLATGRTVTVRFDTNVRGDLPWTFQPLQVSPSRCRSGRPAIAFFRVRNDGPVAITGRASYNVTPSAVGEYFIKTQCFCPTIRPVARGRK